MKKYLLLIPLFLGTLFACEKNDLQINSTQELQEENVAQMFAQRFIAFQDNLAQSNATQFRTSKGGIDLGSKTSVNSPEELMLELEELHLNYDPVLLRLLGQSLNDIRTLELRNQEDSEAFAENLDLAFQKAFPKSEANEVNLRRYAAAQDCRMCCARTYDDQREDISRDFIRCMTLGGGLLEPTIGWSCVAGATYEIIENNIDLQNCLNGN